MPVSNLSAFTMSHLSVDFWTASSVWSCWVRVVPVRSSSRHVGQQASIFSMVSWSPLARHFCILSRRDARLTSLKFVSSSIALSFILQCSEVISCQLTLKICHCKCSKWSQLNSPWRVLHVKPAAPLSICCRYPGKILYCRALHRLSCLSNRLSAQTSLVNGYCFNQQIRQLALRNCRNLSRFNQARSLKANALAAKAFQVIFEIREDADNRQEITLSNSRHAATPSFACPGQCAST